MTFQPVVPATGIAGWRFLQRTQEAQFEAFSSSSVVQRDTEYFLDKIQDVSSAEDLVKDRRLLAVALGAFGLSDDLDNRYFVQKVLEDGTESDDALANKLTDDRYKRFSQAFGFGPGESAKTSDETEMAGVVGNYREQKFEEAVGETDDAMRIALFAQRELADLASKDVSENAKWYQILGLPAMREMFETAFGLPTAFAQIDIDKQLKVLEEKTQQLTGQKTVSQFMDAEAMDLITTRYLARSQIDESGFGNSSRANALTLLQAAGY